MRKNTELLPGAIAVIAAKMAVAVDLFFIDNRNSKVQIYKIC